MPDNGPAGVGICVFRNSANCAGVLPEPEIKSCKHKNYADIHRQPFPKSASEKRNIDGDYNCRHDRHVEYHCDPSFHLVHLVMSATNWSCRRRSRDVVVVVPTDKIWTADPFASSPDYHLAEARVGRWRTDVRRSEFSRRWRERFVSCTAGFCS
jgi:hypothetical protein